MLNRVVLIGRLTKDPELRYTPNGVAVASFTLAVNRSRANQQGERETDFIPIVVWQKQAENCANFIGKGSLVAVDGRIQVRSYDDKEGQRRWMTEVIAENVRFLDRRDSGSSQGAASLGSEVEFSEDDIPF
ncbi:MAG: single-stranded DNA-binding protein [Peptococcaceae bacterium]|jgi:single-strand DNA-binding protein|nr:single-stranded DNA-binding protein [Peptococcaceae bacterium]MDH7523786.1 single-stranded DNA-binding protein [Peptococcaceae bacterium]